VVRQPLRALQRAEDALSLFLDLVLVHLARAEVLDVFGGAFGLSVERRMVKLSI